MPLSPALRALLFKRRPVVVSFATITDAFDRADNAASLGTAPGGQVWSALAGTWGISSNKAVVAAGAGDKLAVMEGGQADAIIQATLNPVLTGPKLDGVVFRVQDANNYLGARLIVDSSQIQVFKRVAGVFTALFVPNYSESTTTILKVELIGTTINVYTNGVLKGTGTGVTDFLTQTKHGLYANGTTTTTWNDFSISAP